MKKKIEVTNARLSFTKETVAKLSDQELDQILGGQEAEAFSTRSNLTCGWCTSETIPTLGVEEAS